MTDEMRFIAIFLISVAASFAVVLLTPEKFYAAIGGPGSGAFGIGLGLLSIIIATVIDGALS